MLEVEIKAALTGHTKEQLKKAAEKLNVIKLMTKPERLHTEKSMGSFFFSY